MAERKKIPGRRSSVSPDNADKIRFRSRLLIVLSLAAALIIVFRFAFIMLSADRDEGTPVQTPAVSERGAIVDRNGRLIAMQTRLWSITAWKPDIDDVVKTSELLGEILDEDPADISRGISRSASRFLFIKRQASPTESDAVRTLIQEGKLPGIGLQEELGRHYPMKELAASLIGYVGTDNVGLDGIEYAFDRVLAPGGMTLGSDRIYGHTVRLTLDMDAQYLTERIAREAWETHNPDSMMVLVMDAKTAEIISWVSLPSFDPNTFSDYTKNERLDRPLTMAYEPGSVFKVFSWASLLDRGAVDTDAVFDTRSGYDPEVFQKYDIPPITDLSNYGVLNLEGALVHSSNVAVAQATENIDANAFYTMLKNFGFGAPTGLPLPGESHGLLNPVSDWSARSKPTIAIGQEVGVSAVQVAAAATTLANGGVLLQPRIVKDVVAADGTVIKDYPRTPVREVISPKTARTMLDLMEKTVSDPGGTSRRAAVDGLRISAKSGTAQITDPETGQYSKNRFLSSVLALFPTDDPQLIVYVVLENPTGGSIYGAQTAAPVVKEIAQELAPLRGIPVAGNEVMTHPGTVHVENPQPMPLGDTLHDMRGYSKRMLLGYLEHDEIEWTIDGDGWVVYQFPPPGTPMDEVEGVYLELR